MRRKANMPYLALLLQLLSDLQTAALAQDVIELRRAIHMLIQDNACPSAQSSTWMSDSRFARVLRVVMKAV